jgi:hypothetical protein
MYPVPDPMRSHEEWWRATHRDLETMGPEVLRLERGRVRLALLLTPGEPPAWLVEREAAIQAALQEAQRGP